MTLTVRSPDQIARTLAEVAKIPDAAMLNSREASEFLHRLGRPIGVNSLRTYRATQPTEPPFAKRGKFAVYRAGDLRRFALGED